MTDSDFIFRSLNEEQTEAVRYRGGPLLIVAGAGSGKTRVLTHRIAYLIYENTPADHILAVTFTNKAADVMRARISHLVHRHVTVGTFHSVCLRILRNEAEHLDFPRAFTIYDEQDQVTIVKESMKELGINPDQMNPRGIVEAISRAKDRLEMPDDLEGRMKDRYDEMVTRVYRRYQQTLTELKGMDFGDLLMSTVRIFEDNPDTLRRYQDMYPYLFVDEYQDTNHAQYRFVKLLAEPSQQITAVGDPDQSIYAWRGADIQNILDFEHDFKNVRVMKLEQNYRSTSNILSAANGLIRHNVNRKEKNLWSTRGDGESIELYEAADEKDEARYVIGRIRAYRKKGLALRDMVIFYRVHAQSRIFEDELRRYNVHYKIVGGVRFYDRKEIKDLVAYLKVIQNPLDSLSLQRILNVPPRGLGKKALDILTKEAAARRMPLYRMLEKENLPAGLTDRSRKTLNEFRAFIERCRRGVHEGGMVALMERIIEHTGYIRRLEEERNIEAKMRIENVQEFFNVLTDFERSEQAENGAALLESFLERISLISDIDEWDQENEVLAMMTLHSAKGLEFPVVFMVGLEDGLFPHSFGSSESDVDIEEERRLCYVGMTRAKDRFHMSFAQNRQMYGIRKPRDPSRFLREIPGEYLEYISGVRNGYRPAGRPHDDEDRLLSADAKRSHASYERVERPDDGEEWA